MPLPEPVRDLTEAFLDEVDERLPHRLTGLLLHGSLCWGEFFDGSDVDFVGVWAARPAGADLIRLEEAHQATGERFPSLVFDGFHCTADDLGRDPSRVGLLPVSYEGLFAGTGCIDINLVTWHELAERPVVVRGPMPRVHTDLPELLAFTRENLDTYWRGAIAEVEDEGVGVVGEDAAAVAWIVLGASRLHHLLNKGTLTSKSGAGRYVAEKLAPRWSKIGREALRIRETPHTPSLYTELAERGHDVQQLLIWLVEDGTH